MRRNLLAFLVGAAATLAVVLATRPDAGAPASAPATATVRTAPQAARAVRLPRHRDRLRHRRTSTGAMGTPDRATAAVPAPPARGAGAAPRTTPRPSTTPATTPATVPSGGDGGTGTTTTGPPDGPATTPSSQGAATTPQGGTLTIPNPATPDASVGPPGG
ncbi:hypothetical protein FSW04_05895 [Baekduia soli]|uniref:Uncharacterized protein n=1 Tax=Baekduia soli TaxID=496014 RepID=A0A5B8U2C4_9ACTN|nr:hypothetical protein [Baekduia soli]QEC47167.1 hypothetical protein FSW04_05895 [Baekduia soli]